MEAFELVKGLMVNWFFRAPTKRNTDWL